MSMTKQEIFTRVAVHMLRQGVPSKTESGSSCAYRGVGGLKCAIGALIPDEACTPFFLEHFNSSGVQNFEVISALIVAGVIDNRYDDKLRLLLSLQMIHDSHGDYKKSSWEYQLKEYAEANGLQMPRAEDIDVLCIINETTETTKEYDHV